MNTQVFLSRVQTLIWEVTGREEEDLSLDMQISDLGIDSVAIFEIIGALEDEFDVYLPDERVSELKTLRELWTLIRESSPSILD